MCPAGSRPKGQAGWKPSSGLVHQTNYFAWAALTSTTDWVTYTTEMWYLTVLEGRDLRSKCQQVWFLLRPLTLASKHLSLPLSLCMGVCVCVCARTLMKMCVCVCGYANERLLLQAEL